LKVRARVIASFVGMAAIWCGLVYVKTGISHGPATIQAVPRADAVAISPDGKTLYTADGLDSGGVTVVNLQTGRAGRRIAVGGSIALAITPDGRTLYALGWTNGDASNATENGDQVTPVDLATGRAKAPMRFPYGVMDMVPSPDGKELYVLANTGKSSAAVIAVNAAGQETVITPVSAYSQVLAISPDSRMLYISGARDRDPKDQGVGEVMPLDAESGKAGTPIELARSVMGLAFSLDGHMLYALGANQGSGPCSLSAIDVATGTVSKPLNLDPQCLSIAAAPDGRALYVLNADETITPVSTETGDLGSPIRTGDPWDPMDLDLVIAPDGRTIYVADQVYGVAVIPVSG
jgi:DNA-binding beta-propeller fold protein YncE